MTNYLRNEKVSTSGSLPPLQSKVLSKVATDMAHEQIEKVSEKKRSLASSQNRSRETEAAAESASVQAEEEAERPSSRLPSLNPTPEPRFRSFTPGSHLEPEEDDFPVAQGFEDTGLERLQGLWEAHEVAMDTAGEKFVETMERVHTATLQNMSRIQEFDLKQVLSEMQQHAQSVRHLVMENFQGTREMEGQFAMNLFNTARQTYERGLNDLYEKTTKHYRERMRVMKLANDQLVARERLAGRDEQKNVLKQQESLLQFTLEEKFDEERMMMQELHAGVQTRNDELHKVIEDREHDIIKLKQEVLTVQKDLKLARAWKVKYEQEKERNENITKAGQDTQTAYAAKVASLEQTLRMETQRRDRELDRLRKHVIDLEGELKELKTDANIAYIRQDIPNVKGPPGTAGNPVAGRVSKMNISLASPGSQNGKAGPKAGVKGKG